MSFWGLHWVRGSQTGVRNGLIIKNAPMKLKLCTQGFSEVENPIKLIIFDEIENFPYLQAIFVILGLKMGQNCDYFQKK